MSDKIMVQWADMTRKTASLIPWWVGCQVVARGSRLFYWCPVEDAVTERVNRDAGVEAWLTATGRDYVLVELGRPGLQLFTGGRITKFDDGGVAYELEVTDAVARSRDLDEVQAFLVEETMGGLTAIATRLGVAPPPVYTSAAAPVRRGRLADLSAQHGGPLVLISPRYRHRARLDQLRVALAGNEIPIDGGWAAYAVNPDLTSQRPGIDAEFDFTGIERPFDPDTLLSDARIVLLLIASAEHPLPEQQAQLAACVDLVDEHLPVGAVVAGNDSGVMWSATAITQAS